jgi:CRISPR-associated exonuclease Cas4
MKTQTENSLTFTGTQINYFTVCRRKLWLFSHGLNMEQTSDTVYYGKLVHQESYGREKKEIAIDDKIVIDFSSAQGIIHEVKKSRAVEAAHIWQLRYYLYYLKQKGIADVIGEINYPLLRRRESVELTPESEQELLQMLGEIEKILKQTQPPLISVKRSFCTKCSYFDYCYAA